VLKGLVYLQLGEVALVAGNYFTNDLGGWQLGEELLG
jgi:hypothetical protein